MKRLLIFIILFLPILATSCDCIWISFCDNDSPGKDPVVLLIKLDSSHYLPNPERPDKYYDVQIVDQLFGPQLGEDSITWVYRNSSCNIPISSFTDTVIIELMDVEKDAFSRYPVFTPFSCRHHILNFENDSVFGNISAVDSLTPWTTDESMAISEFVNFYELNCSETAFLPDLDELNGVELIQNPIYTDLLLKNNLDVEVGFAIHDLNGSFIFNGVISANTTLETDVSTLSQGVYFVRVDDGIGQKFHKVLKL